MQPDTVIQIDSYLLKGVYRHVLYMHTIMCFLAYINDCGSCTDTIISLAGRRENFFIYICEHTNMITSTKNVHAHLCVYTPMRTRRETIMTDNLIILLDGCAVTQMYIDTLCKWIKQHFSHRHMHT